MRDYRGNSAALRARYRHVPVRLPDVRRVLLTSRPRDRTVLDRILVARPLTVAVTVDASRTEHRHEHRREQRVAAPMRTERAPQQPVQPATQTTGAPVHRTQVPGTAAAASVAAAVERAASSTTSVAATAAASGRHEARLATVEQVLARPAASAADGTAPATPLLRSPYTAIAAPDRPSSSSPSSATAPTSAELAVITNSVMSAIDQRLIAHAERLGRG